MAEGSFDFFRKVHARAICDDSSDCAKRINKLWQGGVPDGGGESKLRHDVSAVKFHSDEPSGN